MSYAMNWLLCFLFITLSLINYSDSAVINKNVKTNGPISDPNCYLERVRGKTCAKGKKGLKWFFDIETLKCLPFTYNGCGGNENRYDSEDQCHHKCPMPEDYGTCHNQSSVAPLTKGDCSQARQGEKACPDGYKCQMMAFFGECCHTATEEMYERNYSPKCANGKPVHSTINSSNKWRGGEKFLGKSCEDEFCPTNMTCVQQEIFAHCCPK